MNDFIVTKREIVGFHRKLELQTCKRKIQTVGFIYKEHHPPLNEKLSVIDTYYMMTSN